MNLIRLVRRLLPSETHLAQTWAQEPLDPGLRSTSIPVLKASNRSQLRAEVGAGGVSYISGILDSDEFNAKLTGITGVETYDKMRRTDAQVAGVINACTLPILGARCDVERPADEAEAARISDEHLDFARYNLFTRINFPAFLRHATSCLWSGYSWFERVYAMEDERLVLHRLSPRLATTLWRWWTDDTGELIGVQQKVWRQRSYQYLDYPRDKIALFVFDQEANNYEGKSILRPCFKHWTIKDVLYKLDAIRAERFAVGVPDIKLPRDYDDKLYQMAQEIGKNWKGAEQSYVISVEGMTVQIIQVQGGESLDLMQTIQHHNEEIAKAALVQFLNFGTTQTGSRALGDSSQEFFYDAAEGWAKTLASAIEREILWPLMDYNYADQIRPRVVFKDLGALSLGQLTEALKSLGSTFITPAFEIENALRERLNLPPMTDEQWEEKEETAKAVREAAAQARNGQVAEEDENAPVSKGKAPNAKTKKQPNEPEDVEKVEAHRCDHDEVHLADGLYWRPLRPAEEVVNLGQIAGTLDDSRDRIMGALKAARDSWVPALFDEILKAWPRGPRGIATTEIPDRLLVGPRTEVLRIENGLFRFGQEQVNEELQAQARKQGRKLPEPHVKTLLAREPMDLGDMADLVEERTDILVTRLKRTTEEAAWNLALEQWRVRGTEDLSPEDVDQMMEDIFGRAELESRLIASMSVTETLNLGRQVGWQAVAESGELDFLEYSAILDLNVCSPCRALDGKRMEYGSPDFWELQPPLNSRKFGRCRGRQRCRCLLIGVLAAENA